MDLDALVAKASAILDDAAEPFIAGHRAESAVSKRGDDFATKVDLEIERQVVDALEKATGIAVHGEEFGGAELDSPWVWVLDPVDGTFNYAAGSPMAAILLGLLHDGDPVAGLTWLPFTGVRYVAVVGQWADEKRCAAKAIGHGRARGIGHRCRHLQCRLAWPISGPLPAGGARRAQPGIVAAADAWCHRHRPRICRRRDSGGAISFGDHVWDHAAGVALVRAAGGIVTNLAGEEWTPIRGPRWPPPLVCTPRYSKSCGG